MDMPIDAAPQEAVALSHDSHRAELTNAFVQVVPPETAAPDGPLADLKFGVKEVIEQKGLLSPWGVPFLSDRIGAVEATVVTRLRQAGARRVGTTRSTLMAITGDSGARNPLDLSRTPGGSSAGSAAAVALDAVDFALGTQTVGSIIRPASYCGVVGFKPTFDMLPTDGVMCLSRDLDHIGILARDVATVDRVMQAISPMDTTSAPLTKAIVPDTWFDGPIDPAVTAVCAQAVQGLQALGVAPAQTALPRSVTEAEADLMHLLLCKGIDENHRAFIAANAAALPSELRGFADHGQTISDADLAEARNARDQMAATMAALIDNDAVVILPSVLDLPPLLGDGTGRRDPQRLWTLLGWPAITVPLGTYGGALDHLSIGVQLAAKPGCDAALLSIAAKLAAWHRPA